MSSSSLSRFVRLATGGLRLILISLSVTAAAAVPVVAAPSPTPSEWPAHGRDHAEQRYSPLDRIDNTNVASLGLGWFFEMPDRIGLEATPIVVDGVMYVTGGWNRIYALDAATGRQRWQYDPAVDRRVAHRFCCGAVNRGVALWGDRLYSATLDGRLIALERQTGKLVWSVQTTDPALDYSITGAPRVVSGKVIIGNGGAETGVRGYVSAYDAVSGELAWRFYTVPGNPEQGFENPAMAMAAKTWNGEWWKLGGGGGTVWDSMAYDPELNLLYIGVGNGGPHNRRLRSPGGGDNLFLSSIVALDADTGEYAWHYQETPAENWDYTATQHIVLADILWQGKPRKVLLHAPKNGFFFVIDRQSGELLSAKPYTEVNWASGYDFATGRPVETPGSDYADAPALIKPSGVGGHNWHPMAYSRDTGLVYIPTIKLSARLEDVPAAEFRYLPRHWNLGYRTPPTPDNPLFAQALLRAITGSALVAWDPVRQQAAWTVEQDVFGNGGVLATAGGLVFQGTADGYFSAYAAADGTRLWDYRTGNGIGAGAVSYAVDGEQYVAVAAGLGGGVQLVIGIEPEPQPPGRILAFRLGGKVRLPDLQKPVYPTPPSFEIVPDGQTDVAHGRYSQAQVDRGRDLYHQFCYRCHGVNAVSDGEYPDLRRLDPAWHRDFNRVLLEGMMESAGMPRFDDVLTATDADAIHAWVLHKASQDQALRQQPAWWIALQTWFYERVASLVALLL